VTPKYCINKLRIICIPKQFSERMCSAAKRGCQIETVLPMRVDKATKLSAEFASVQERQGALQTHVQSARSVRASHDPVMTTNKCAIIE